MRNSEKCTFADEKQKAATELLQKSQKGRWVNVPAGKTVQSAVEEEELLQAKIIADAGKARKAVFSLLSLSPSRDCLSARR